MCAHVCAHARVRVCVCICSNVVTISYDHFITEYLLSLLMLPNLVTSPKVSKISVPLIYNLA